MKKRKSLIIGANSFIGSHLVEALSSLSDVTAVFNQNTDRLSDKVRNISVAAMDELDEQFDDVYIVSAYINTGAPDKTARNKLYEANVELVGKVCSNFTGARFIYCSSVSVYKIKDDTVYENDNEGGLNEYGISKLWGEKIIAQTGNYAIVRFSSVYGAGMQENTIIPRYIKQALTSGVINVYGKGSRVQNYIHVSDAVNFLIKSAALEENGIFLACADASISNADLANEIAGSIVCDVEFTGEDNSPSFIYNNEATVQKLNYKVQVSLNEGVNQVIKWIEKKC